MITPKKFRELRFERLLSAGYFPAELPPPFTTVEFAKNASNLSKSWIEKDVFNFWTAPEHYSIPRHGQIRRKLSIVNPATQLWVSRLVADNWIEIRNRITRSKASEFKPSIRLTGGGRAVSGIDFDKVSRQKVRILARYGRYVQTDIARFYPSIYTHSIPWALYGKDYAKKNFKTKAFRDSFGSKLDQAIRAGQAGQTVGIPIGPDTSRILSELVASELENITKTNLPDFDERTVRYVDDLIIGISDSETAEEVLSNYASALYQYELELNAAKTQIRGLGYSHHSEWRQFIRNFRLSSSAPTRQMDDLDSYFEQMFTLAQANPNDSVISFGARRAASFDVCDENRFHLFRWMLYSIRREPSCLNMVVEHLSNEHALGRSVPIHGIGAFIKERLPREAESGHTAEVAWLLFWARELKISLPGSIFAPATALMSSVVALLVFDLRQQGLITGRIDESNWSACATGDGLASEMWLVAYEATKKGWWAKAKTDTFIKSHQQFKDILDADVNFYEEGRKARPQVGIPFFSMLRNLRARYAHQDMGNY